MSMPSGTGSSAAAGAATFSAKPPKPETTMTRSPVATLVTPSPTWDTTPAISPPGEKGNCGFSWYLFSMMRVSGKLTPAAQTSMTTWPGDATGSSTSSTTSDSGGPNDLHRTARTVDKLPGSVLAQAQ